MQNPQYTAKVQDKYLFRKSLRLQHGADILLVDLIPLLTILSDFSTVLTFLLVDLIPLSAKSFRFNSDDYRKVT